MWQRTQRLVNIYATTALDVSFPIFWLSAFCAVQVWTDGGINSSRGCEDFAYGSESKCRISYGTAILAIMILYVSRPPPSVYPQLIPPRTVFFGSLPPFSPSIPSSTSTDTATSRSSAPPSQNPTSTKPLPPNSATAPAPKSLIPNPVSTPPAPGPKPPPSTPKQYTVCTPAGS